MAPIIVKCGLKPQMKVLVTINIECGYQACEGGRGLQKVRDGELTSGHVG